ncbi:hypothetical protein COCSADRAFT_168853 [Bipolaris sorokiniana ND90Pr]|uniref:Uncharacterized protein n=1 Tax=Cochliobolus sativus (strain ND90Pr / ATCC 201652) TaxID=665912 RepID=M2TEM3_COCSN|nr:uncharacterized protein COCSADRAFT_168853 [Bipolaris sorokiniana ND90Pr]EMD67676.1 hypothetical protein COCSADRAFT_168853 [Bipolaris sorokiniana ND90Pr]
MPLALCLLRNRIYLSSLSDQTSIPHVFFTSRTKPTLVLHQPKAAPHILLGLIPTVDEHLDLGEYSKPGERLVLLDHEIDSTVSILQYIDEHMVGSSLFA